MIKQNKTKLQFILAATLMLTLSFTACNNDGEKKDAVKDAPVTVTPAPSVKDSTDTMESKTGKVAPGSDVKPQ
jgi:hypothetical protein